MTTKFPFLVLKEVNKPIEDTLIKAVADVIKSGIYINGKYVDTLEKAIASLCNAEHAIAVSNGLDALRLIIRAYKEMGVFSDGDEIIMQANTYIASALAVSNEGLKPVFVDISPVTLNLDTSAIERAVTCRTKAIMPVHLYGTPCWDDAIMSAAEKHGLKIIEDNAQAIGAKSSRPGLSGTFSTGGLGDAAGISFYPTKNLGALGDAGMIVTRDKELADIARALANYGADRRYHNVYNGSNCRMDEMQAAVLLAKLPFLNGENNRRRELVQIYNSTIKNPQIQCPQVFGDMYQVWHQYPLRVANRESFRKFMEENGVATDIIYPVPVYKQPCYENKYPALICPEAEKFATEVVCLPIGAHISNDDAKEISEIINRF
ncbi:MAG: DegT/DnrJ/EryC1/StrS family aminotransferase [Muribaculaceae bacterium]|nr:DegT/DnrJ/EryC1/StrS family aminotransferase [Muribaculaceae bacterium]